MDDANIGHMNPYVTRNVRKIEPTYQANPEDEKYRYKNTAHRRFANFLEVGSRNPPYKMKDPLCCGAL